MKDCPNKAVNLASCNCSYGPCPRKGLCCACLQYHRAQKQLPACFFSAAAERTYDRSFSNFIKSAK
jgi:hypothetical protein